MKTAELISALARDLRPVSGGALRRRLTLAIVAGGCLTLIVLLMWLGLRPLGEAVRTGPFWMKAIYTGSLSFAGIALAARLARPGGAHPAALRAIVVIFAIMICLGLGQLVLAQPEARPVLWQGMTWNICSFRILVLASPIFVAAMWAMRSLAPTRPTAAGAAAGLVAGALGATLYGLHCPETAATFVAIWYTLGIVACTALGALIGSRLLRW